jgi:hypothetical protein
MLKQGADMVVIARRFCGPPDTGNGGYSAGLVAQSLSGAVEVTLRKPPPLARELTLHHHGDRAELLADAELVAEARQSALELVVPSAPTFEQAVELSKRYVGYEQHHFPTCFVCGPARAVGDGLRIFPASNALGEPCAAPWLPPNDLTNGSGHVRHEVMWAALDCVGYFGVAAPDYPVALLGRITAEVIGHVRAGERCVVLGWSLGREGRKLQAGTAVFGGDGELKARARQTWITLPPASPRSA